MDLTSFHNQFRDETAEHIRLINDGLLALEAPGLDADARREHIDAIFRAMHTIKGSARMLGFPDVGKLAHACEHILGAIRDGQRSLDSALADDLLRGADAIMELVSAGIEGRSTKIDAENLCLTLGRGHYALANDAPEAARPTDLEARNALPDTQAPILAPAAQPNNRLLNQQTVRVRVDRLDRLLNLSGELAVDQQIQLSHLQALEHITGFIAEQERALTALEREIGQLRFSTQQRTRLERHLNGALNAGDRASTLLKTQVEHFGQHVDHAKQLVESLEQEIMAVRLLPISTLFSNLQRAVRELAREMGKHVELVLSGETTELDRKIIESLNDPLIHLIRNAVDHGVETAEQREHVGKPAVATLRISAVAHGPFVHIAIEDDGRGINTYELRAIAVRKGLLSAEAAALLTDQEATELIFTPGFSTAQIITDISGRGVGMDVVQTNIAELGGRVLIESQLHHGTTITLVVPLTLVTTHVLFVELGEHIFALPATACSGSVWARTSDLKTIDGHAMLPYEGRLVTLLRLADLLDVAGALPFPAQLRMPAVLVGMAQRPLALIVDRLLDEREVVVKPLGPLFEKQRRFSGAIQLGDGRLVLLVNPLALADVARNMELPTPVAKHDLTRRFTRLLVADDSFTTRELMRTILHSAGYDVTTATDGRDALDKLRSDTYDLVVSDVEMPQLDGFELTSRIRSELGLIDLPVIIVTSLASDAHRRRGLEVGAQAYIVKSQFNQSNLLETVQQLLA